MKKSAILLALAAMNNKFFTFLLAITFYFQINAGVFLSDCKSEYAKAFAEDPSIFVDFPLIGIYDVEVLVFQNPKQSGWSPTKSAQFSQKCVINSQDDDEFFMGFYDKQSGLPYNPLLTENSVVLAALNGILSQIGSSNVYNYTFLPVVSKEQHRIVIDNPWNFTIKVQLSPETISYIFGRYNGTDIVVQMNFIREYPTQIMLNNALEIEHKKQFEKAQPTEWSGTCTAIGRDMVVTNYHVVEEARTLTICNKETYGNVEYAAQVLFSDRVNDLAVLKVTDSRFRGFEIKYGLKYSVADIGTDIFVLGYPLIETMGESIKLTTGVISAKTGFQGDMSQYQISAAVQPGNSGGPLFDNRGNLIGIVSSKHRGTENVGYAIKLSYLRNLVESANTRINLNSTNSISSLSLSEKIKRISPCVMIVKAKK